MLPLLAAIAAAQERACEAVPTATLENHLIAAEAALDAVDSATAGPALERASEAARCLDSPIPSGLLARIAWGRAELAAGDMDPELAWTWIRLGHDAGKAEPPARVPDNHPLHAIAAEPHDPLPMSGPEGVALHAPRKGAVYADGAPIEQPVLRVSTPHLLQVFDKEGTPWLGSWQEGAVFPSAMLVPLVSEGRRQRGPVAGDDLPPAGWKPRKKNTEAAFREWVKKHPDGPYLQDAKDGIDDLHWAAAQKAGTDMAIREYLHAHPNGLHADEAEFIIEDAEYRKLLEEPSREAWVAFVESWPDGTYTAEARVQIELADWNAAAAIDESAAYGAYVAQHPKGRNAERAALLEEQRALDEARASGLDSALEKFLGRWPDGDLAGEARAILGGVEFEFVTLGVTGDVPQGVRDRVRAALLAELEERKLPVLEDGGDPGRAGRLEVSLTIEPGGSITDVGALLTLRYADLKYPLNELRIASKMLPGGDAGAMLGELLTTNLRSFERWRPERPEDAGLE